LLLSLKVFSQSAIELLNLFCFQVVGVLDLHGKWRPWVAWWDHYFEGYKACGNLHFHIQVELQLLFFLLFITCDVRVLVGLCYDFFLHRKTQDESVAPDFSNFIPSLLLSPGLLFLVPVISGFCLLRDRQ
jgi:hypothetical protein